MTAPALGPAALTAAGLVAPGSTGADLSDVLPAVADTLGAGRGPGDAAARQRLGLPRATRVLVVLVDGLGRLNLAERSRHAPFLRTLATDAHGPDGTDGVDLVAGYPSTTASSLGTFGTGLSAGRTGLVGYTARNPATGGLGNLVQWTGLPEPELWQREPTLFEHLEGSGLSVTAVGPARFEGSGMSRAALRGGAYRRCDRAEDRVAVAVEELMAPGLVYLYWGEIDKAGHHHGWGSRQWGDELALLDRELARLERQLPPGTLLLVTADHGMVDVDRTRRWDVATTAGLREGVEIVAGEPRAVHVHVPGGSDAEVRAAAVADRWRDVLGDAAVVATREEAVAGGWFGDVAAHVRPLLGDVVAAATGRATIVDSATQTAASLTMVGVHGSLTPHEMRIPLLTMLR